LNNGNATYYEYCKRPKGNIMDDMQYISFEVPQLFRMRPCYTELDRRYLLSSTSYIYDREEDSFEMSVYIWKTDDSTPLSITSSQDELITVGPYRHSIYLSPGIWYSKKENLWKQEESIFLPEVFLEKKIEWHETSQEGDGIPIEFGWVDTWPNGRCARILFNSEKSYYYLNKVEYYCWPSYFDEKLYAPFSLSASQFIQLKTKGIRPPESDFTDLDNALIKPVLDSLKLHPLRGKRRIW